MKIKNIFNSMGFSGQLGKLGNIITTLNDNVNSILENLPVVSEDVVNIKNDLNDLTELVGKLKLLINVTVTFNSDGGSSVESQSISFGNSVTEPDIPIKDGYTFVGWFVDEEEFDFETILETNITLTAHWAEVEGE